MIYLNNAATSFPKPAEVMERVARSFGEAPAEQARGSGNAGQSDPQACRLTAAAFFDIEDVDHLIFTSGATESLNTLIFGMTEPGWKVITTEADHNSTLRPLFQLEDSGMIELDIVKCGSTGHIKIADLKAKIDSNPDLLVINHVSNVTGAIQDIEKIIDICSKKEVKIILDASQSAGHLPVSDFGYDKMAFAFTGHKGLFGIQGSGGFYISPGLSCRPLKVGGSGNKSELRRQPPDLPLYYEAGTRSIPGIVSMDEGIKWINRKGLSRISAGESKYRSILAQALSGINKVKVYGVLTGAEFSGVLSFNIEDFSSNEVSYILEKSFGIITRPGLHCAPLIHKAVGTFPEGTVRVSFSAFNTEDDIFHLIEAVKAISESSPDVL